MFKASDVKELRDKTGAGMLDCKKIPDNWHLKFKFKFKKP